MKKLLSHFLNLRINKPAELVIGEREAIQGNVNTNVMLKNLKLQYQQPYGINESKISDSIKTYQDTLVNVLK